MDCKPDQTRPALATPRPPFFPILRNIEAYIRLPFPQAQAVVEIHQWLTKVKKVFLLATISSKGCLRLVFRQALPSPLISFRCNSYLTSSRYLVFRETSIWVSPSLFLALRATLTAIQDSWSVLFLSYLRSFSDMIAGSC
jgi:hypothetical protein